MTSREASSHTCVRKTKRILRHERQIIKPPPRVFLVFGFWCKKLISFLHLSVVGCRVLAFIRLASYVQSEVPASTTNRFFCFVMALRLSHGLFLRFLFCVFFFFVLKYFFLNLPCSYEITLLVRREHPEKTDNKNNCPLSPQHGGPLDPLRGTPLGPYPKGPFGPP